MACPSDQTLAAFLDDQLMPGDRRELEAHLATCERCQSLIGHSVATIDLQRKRRDYFAAAALTALLQNVHVTLRDPADTARVAFDYADAMLIESERDQS